MNPVQTFLLVDCTGDKKNGLPTTIDAIFCAFRVGQKMVRRLTIPEELRDDLKTPMEQRSPETERKLDILQHELLNFNWMFDNAEIIVSHGVDFDRFMITNIPEFSHWNWKPWVCTFRTYKWPCLYKDDETKRRLPKLCKLYGVEEETKDDDEKEEDQTKPKRKFGNQPRPANRKNNAQLLLDCLLKSEPLLQMLTRLANTPPVQMAQ